MVASAPAGAQQTRTPEEQAVYRDYRTDGLIVACDHTLETLQSVLAGIGSTTQTRFPDFRPQVQAAIREHQGGSCAGSPSSSSATGGGAAAGATPTGSADGGGAQPAGQSGGTGAASGSGASSGSGSGASSGSSASSGSGSGASTGSGGSTSATGGNSSSTPPTADQVTPLPPATAAPAATPGATPVPAIPAATPVPVATPAVVYRNADDPLPVALIALAVLLALCALLGLAYAILVNLSWADGRLSRPRRAWREAAFRAGAVWGDFTDWLRLGR